MFELKELLSHLFLGGGRSGRNGAEVPDVVEAEEDSGVRNGEVESGMVNSESEDERSMDEIEVLRGLFSDPA